MNPEVTIPLARDEMTVAEFDSMMTRGMDEAQADLSKTAAEVFTALKQEYGGK